MHDNIVSEKAEKQKNMYEGNGGRTSKCRLYIENRKYVNIYAHILMYHIYIYTSKFILCVIYYEDSFYTVNYHEQEQLRG